MVEASIAFIYLSRLDQSRLGLHNALECQRCGQPAKLAPTIIVNIDEP